MATDAQHRTIATERPPVVLSRDRRDRCGSSCAAFTGMTRCCISSRVALSLQCTSCGYETPGWDVQG